MSQLAVIVRFNPDGYIDAYNKTTYAAESAVPYSGNKAYSFRLEVRPEMQDFDVYVTPVSDDKKLSWVTDPPGRINDFNLLSEEQNSGTAMLYRVESDMEGIHSVTDIAKIIGIADREWNETEYLTAEQAVRLLRGICYFYE